MYNAVDAVRAAVDAEDAACIATQYVHMHALLRALDESKELWLHVHCGSGLPAMLGAVSRALAAVLRAAVAYQRVSCGSIALRLCAPGCFEGPLWQAFYYGLAEEATVLYFLSHGLDNFDNRQAALRTNATVVF